MKLRIAIISLLALLLLAGACDRYDHDFSDLPTGDVDSLESFLSIVEHYFSILNRDNFANIEALYAEDYIHNGVDKSERLAWIESFLDEPGVLFEVSDKAWNHIIDNHGVVNWRLKVLSPDAKAVLADSLFVGEKVRYGDEGWVLLGNQACVPDESKKLVIAEYFTFDSCPNCPPAEAKLNELQEAHPNFIYLEHHIANTLLVQGNDTANYYSAFGAPTTVFQGMSKVTGSGDEQLDAYESIVSYLVSENRSIEIELQNISANSQEISTLVMLNPLEELDLTDMYLNYVIITDEVSQTNVNGEPLHNVVRAVGRSLLIPNDLTTGKQISLSTSGAMPSNYKLVVFVQYRPPSFTNESRIYDGIVHSVSAK